MPVDTPASTSSTRAPAAEPGGVRDPETPPSAAEPSDRVILVKPGATHPSSPRAALDALIAGDRPLALARYRALAQHDPGQLAYGAAATLLAEIEREAASRREN